jgi:myo-inositol 2-dehydrogenase/D-chiro-inositol 1-dehydrogenase
VIGAGRIGAIHADNLARRQEISSIVVTDVSAEAAEAVASRHANAAIAPHHEDMDGLVDAVVICSPADTHVPLIEWCLAAGLPALCEKPLAMTLPEADRAVAAAADSPVPIQIGFNRRFDPGYRSAHEKVAAGELGTVTMLVGQHHDYELSSPEYIARSGGEFKDQLIHDFDILRFVTGQEVIKVHAAGTTTGFEWFGDYGDFAHTAATLWMSDGALAVLCGSRRDPVGYDVRLEVHGTGDSIAVGLDPRTPLRSVEVDGPDPADPYRDWVPRFGHTYEVELGAFLALAAGDGPNPCTVADARAALVIAEVCMLSAQEGRTVDVKEVS